MRRTGTTEGTGAHELNDASLTGMSNQAVAQDVRTFIARYIDSVAELEALLLLRAHPRETWCVPEVAQRLYVSEPETSEILRRLSENGLLADVGAAFSYRCATPELELSVDRLAESYARQLIAVTNIIHAKPRRIREFADAFKFRKDRS